MARKLKVIPVENEETFLCSRFPHHVVVPDLWDNDEYVFDREKGEFKFVLIIQEQLGSALTGVPVEADAFQIPIQNPKAVWDYVGDTLLFKHMRDAAWAKLRFA